MLPVDADLSADLQRYTVAEVVDGDTLVLGSGQQVRLTGIQAPKLPLGRPDFEAWPHAEQARRGLSELAPPGTVLSLYYGGNRQDRYGRLLAHIEREDGVWLQGEMLRRGLARVYTFPDNRLLAREMLALEQAARAARRGLWRLVHYRIVRADDVERFDFYELIEGRVLRAERVGRWIYLNFGPDYRTDFTLSLPASRRQDFVAAGKDPMALAERNIRVRGWVYWRNGPMIDLTHPEQIEIIDQGSEDME